MPDTRQRILDASLNLFSQSGYAAVSIRDICARVRVREGTIYYHFPNKRAIYSVGFSNTSVARRTSVSSPRLCSITPA